MLKSSKLILFLLFLIKSSNSASDSNLLELYDLKVKNNEPSCRLVTHANLPEDRRTLAGRGCMCDEECIKYKDCCKDSVYYRPNEQSSPPSHHCSETTAVYLMSKCPSEWEDSDTKNLCKKSIEPLEDEDISMILPISNTKTREVYGNRFCAACNNDVDTSNWVQFPMGVVCGEAPPGYLKSTPVAQKEFRPSSPYISSVPASVPKPYPYVDQKINNELNNEFERENCNHSCQVKVINNIITHPPPGILLDIHLYIYNDTVINGRNSQWPVQLQTVVPTDADNFSNSIGRRKRDTKYKIDFEKYSSKAEEICANAKYDKVNKEFTSEYKNKIFICRFKPVLPEKSNEFTRRCVPFLERKCPNGYKNEAIKEECSIHTNIVYNKDTKKPYRNKDCARCNDEKEENVNGTPQDTRTVLPPSAEVSGKANSGGATGQVSKDSNFTGAH